jgi:predicted amidohydrolase YtcJ
VGADAEELDAGGGTVLPASSTRTTTCGPAPTRSAVQLGDATTLDAVRAAIGSIRGRASRPRVDRGGGLELRGAPGRRPAHGRGLDGCRAGRALMVFSYDVHNAWLNREAMRRFGHRRGRQRSRSAVRSSSEHGEPTGS